MLTIAEYMCGVSNKIHSVHAKQIPFLLVCRHSAHILKTPATDFHLTGHGCVEGEGPQAGELFASGLLHTVTEDVLPGVQLQQLYAL